MNNSPHISKNF
uniref:Uncharacterized protein n=1 Tax=Anguilla anguilla TaxID=7936 RepID=A0A0E9W2U4_ANGAN